MDILVLSDIHGNFDVVSKIVKKFKEKKLNPEFIIIAGDITHFGMAKNASMILQPLKEISDRILFIPGNCDSPEITSLSEEQIYSLHNKVIYLNNFNILGFGGSSLTPFRTLFEFTEDEIEHMLDELIKFLKPEKKTITITHDPPYNTKIDMNKNNIHVGSKSVRSLILKTKPLLHISGHIHEARGVDYLNESLLINPGSGSNGHYVILEISENKVKPIFENVYM
ncbi:MAG: metallophosphoesterase family protein [Candidatus Odinarchaeia archaeon]